MQCAFYKIYTKTGAHPCEPAHLNLNYENFTRFRLQRYENYLTFANLPTKKVPASRRALPLNLQQIKSVMDYETNSMQRYENYLTFANFSAKKDTPTSRWAYPTKIMTTKKSAAKIRKLFDISKFWCKIFDLRHFLRQNGKLHTKAEKTP